jgi:hypothetical protein
VQEDRRVDVVHVFVLDGQAVVVLTAPAMFGHLHLLCGWNDLWRHLINDLPRPGLLSGVKVGQKLVEVRRADMPDSQEWPGGHGT